MARPKGTARAKKPILKKEYERLINATNRSLKLQSGTKIKFIRAFTLLYLTGCRISEITNFTTDTLKNMIENNEYSLTNSTKTKSPRLITFDHKGIQINMIKNIIPTTNKYLFNKNNSDTPMSVAALTFSLNKFIHKILGELYSTHSFRIGYITIAHQIGLSLEHIRQDIGHKSISTTARYATVTSDEIAKAKNLRKW